MTGSAAASASRRDAGGGATEILRDYLIELEWALKQERGVVPEAVLAEALERLAPEAARAEAVGESRDQLRRRLEGAFGEPRAVAAARGGGAGEARGRVEDAPGWRVCCTRCGRSAPAGPVGFVRLGARSVGKYVPGRCTGCSRWSWLHVVRDLDRSNLTSHVLAGATPEQVRRREHSRWMPWAFVALLCLAAVAAAAGVLARHG